MYIWKSKKEMDLFNEYLDVIEKVVSRGLNRSKLYIGVIEDGTGALIWKQR